MTVFLGFRIKQGMFQSEFFRIVEAHCSNAAMIKFPSNISHSFYKLKQWPFLLTNWLLSPLPSLLIRSRHCISTVCFDWLVNELTNDSAPPSHIRAGIYIITSGLMTINQYFPQFTMQMVITWMCTSIFMLLLFWPAMLHLKKIIQQTLAITYL